jgi:hypothetical protein
MQVYAACVNLAAGRVSKDGNTMNNILRGSPKSARASSDERNCAHAGMTHSLH